MEVIINWLPLILFALTFIFVGINRLFRFPVRLQDLMAMVRPVNDCDVQELLDAKREAELRASMTPKEFRQEQRIRILRAFEYQRRRLYNGTLMIGFAYAEQAKWRDNGEFTDKPCAALIQETINAGVEFRIYALFALAKLGFWILLRIDKWAIFPTPSVADLREVNDIDGSHAYYRLTTAVGYLSLFYGEDCYNTLMVALRGRIPQEY
jgi:hypothetical protein